jgi:hypothetical protein
MKRASNTFSVLQATAAIVALAIMLWSFGLPSLRFAEAANVIQVSDTLSDSAPGVVSDHTITFITPTGVANGQSITIDFSDGPFVVGAVDYTDIDVLDDTNDLTATSTCAGATEEVAASFTGTTLTIEFCSGNGAFLPANGTTTIEIGLNATFGVAGDAQLTNPAAGSREINFTAGPSDTGATRVAIVPSVTVTASVDTLFTFTVAGVDAGATVNTADITDGTTTATAIAFGQLTNGNASTTAQDLTVNTNAANGFVVTVTADGQLNSTTGADIDGYRNGNFDSTPVAWEGPTPSLGDEDTYGHWGITTDDGALTSGLTNPFNVGGGGDRFVSASTTPVEVFRHTGPTDGTVQGEGTTRVGYKVEISALQEAADDYTATLTYVATPVF